jgi:hypothetical protein
MCVLRFRLTSVVLGWWSEVNVCFKVQTHISGVRLMVRSQCVLCFKVQTHISSVRLVVRSQCHTLTSDHQLNTTDVSLNLITHIDF